MFQKRGTFISDMRKTVIRGLVAYLGFGGRVRMAVGRPDRAFVDLDVVGQLVGVACFPLCFSFDCAGMELPGTKRTKPRRLGFPQIFELYIELIRLIFLNEGKHALI